MADDNERRAMKRSRFDQTERTGRSDGPGSRSSRFERRSRSPPPKSVHAARDRSPPRREPAIEDTKKSVIDKAAAAAAAAAKINAQINAKKGPQHVDVPPIRSAGSPTDGAASPSATGTVGGDIYIADGDYIKDIEVNDLRNRYTLTKGSTQKMIKEETGADVTTRGNYYPDKSMATAAAPPLYLHVTSTTREGLDKAIAKIDELMQQELPNLVDERRFRRREPEQVERDEFGRRKWPEERVSIDIEPLPGFNLRAQIVGHGGAYVKHIQQETRCRVQIKGRGSGFMEHATGRESDDPMFLHVAGPDPKEVERAKELCEDLVANVRTQFEKFKENPAPRRDEGGYNHNQSHHRDNYPPQRPQSYNTTGYGAGYGASSAPSYGSVTSPPPGTSGVGTGAGSPSTADYAAQYAQYYGQAAATGAPGAAPGAPGAADPYAAYGGYAAYCQYYAYYQQQAAQQAAAAQQAPGAASPPPSAPPGGAPLPPPSGAPPGVSGYNAVPPPPGM